MEKWAEPLGRRGRRFHRGRWKSREFSTGNGERKVFHVFPTLFHRKTSGNVEKGGYRRLLILEVMVRTVSAKEASLAMRCSTCSMECITVVWSRSNSLPMSL